MTGSWSISANTHGMLWNNCQRFLRILFEEIRNPKTPAAVDVRWFKTHMKTKYQHKQKLMKQPPDASRHWGAEVAGIEPHNAQYRRPQLFLSNTEHDDDSGLYNNQFWANARDRDNRAYGTRVLIML